MEDALSIASFNAENFYLLLDRPLDRDELEALADDEYLAMNSSIFNPNKERAKIAEIAATILREDFDLVGLCEVGGMESLSAFNRLYLGEGYDCFLHEENSKRGIFVGALLKKGRFPRAGARNVPVAFSRNLLRLDLGAEGGMLTVFVVHLKSQHGDDRGLEQRIREVKRLAALVRPERCVVMGDFNGVLIRGEQQFEYQPFLDLPLRDVLEAAGVPPAERRTHYYFTPAPSHNQLDYIFCTDDIEVIEASVIEDYLPLNRAERRRLPSDHLFIRAKVRPPRPVQGGGPPPPEGGAARAEHQVLDRRPEAAGDAAPARGRVWKKFLRLAKEMLSLLGGKGRPG